MNLRKRIALTISFEPVPGEFGAHGRFDERANTGSAQWLLSKHRWSAAALATVLLAGAAYYFRRMTDPSS